ncbi:MAG: insulinase family protein [Betaproteobacteria bacterium]|nr:insulinase family protein [Betaproteobacteria bacterium]
MRGRIRACRGWGLFATEETEHGYTQHSILAPPPPVNSSALNFPRVRQAVFGLFVAVALVSPGLAQASGAVAQERVLANGLKVLVKEDRRAPTVVHLIVYRAGSIDEVNGRTGVAHALEHMMFKGTRTVPSGEFSRRVAAMGGRENAFTTRDYTGYFQQIPSKRLAEVMALEADRMTNLVLSAEAFATEREVVIEERRLRTEDRARARVFEQLMAVAFTASPTRQPVIGWMSDLQSMTVPDLDEWYRTWYAPGNATLVVVGDVSATDVFALAERHYGAIAPRALPARKPQDEPQQMGMRSAVVKAPAETAFLLMGFRVPRLERIDGSIEPYALEMLSEVLAGDENGRFTRELVRQQRIADSAGAGYGLTGRGPGLFTLSGVPAAGRTVAEVQKALREQVARVAADGVDERELERIRIGYVASRVYQRDSLMSQAMELAGLEMSGLSHADADRLLERVRAVTSEDVKAVAARYFGDDGLTVVTLDPQPLSGARPAQRGFSGRH